MLTIRLQRTGARNKPSFRIVLAQAHRASGKKSLEVLGHYNPKHKDFAIKDQERLNYWIAQHVSISPTVHNLLVEKKLISEKKVKAWQPKKSAESAKEASAPQVTANVPVAPSKDAGNPAPEGQEIATSVVA